MLFYREIKEKKKERRYGDTIAGAYCRDKAEWS